MSDLFSRMDHRPVHMGLLLPFYWVVACSWLLYFLNSIDYWYMPRTATIFLYDWIEHGEYEEVEDFEKQHRWATVGGYASFFLSIMVLMIFFQSFRFNPIVYSPNILPTFLFSISAYVIVVVGWIRFRRLRVYNFISEMWFPEFGFVLGLFVFHFLFYVWLVRRLTLMLRIMVNVFIGHVMVNLWSHGITFILTKMFLVKGRLISKLLTIPILILQFLGTSFLYGLELFAGCAQLWVFGVLVNLYGDEVL